MQNLIGWLFKFDYIFVRCTYKNLFVWCWNLMLCYVICQFSVRCNDGFHWIKTIVLLKLLLAVMQSFNELVLGWFFFPSCVKCIFSYENENLLRLLCFGVFLWRRLCEFCYTTKTHVFWFDAVTISATQ